MSKIANAETLIPFPESLFDRRGVRVRKAKEYNFLWKPYSDGRTAPVLIFQWVAMEFFFFFLGLFSGICSLLSVTVTPDN